MGLLPRLSSRERGRKALALFVLNRGSPRIETGNDAEVRPFQKAFTGAVYHALSMLGLAAFFKSGAGIFTTNSAGEPLLNLNVTGSTLLVPGPPVFTPPGVGIASPGFWSSFSLLMSAKA